MKTTSLLSSLLVLAMLAASACGGRESPVSPTPLSGGGSTASTFEYGDPPPTPTGPGPTIFGIFPPSGPAVGGTPITISGAGFVEGATVAFGDAPATNVIVVNGEVITAVAPGHAEGTVDIAVTHPDGKAARLGSAYTYTGEAPPVTSTAPAIRRVTPPSGPAAGGTATTIFGDRFVEGATVMFGNVPASGAVVAGSTVIIATTPAHEAGVVDLVVTNPDGLSGTLSGGYTFTSEGPPAPTMVTITITSAGVSPQEVEIAVGSRVAFVNEDSRPHEMNSDPHPRHSDCPEINAVGFIQPGERKETGELRTARTCGFHDHSQPSNGSLRGRIVIRQD